MILSKLPFSSSGSCMGFSKSNFINSLNTPNRSSYSSNLTLGWHWYSPDDCSSQCYIEHDPPQRTSRFFSWMKTLGADTTAIRVSSVAPSNSCLASVVAVSSSYYVTVSGLLLFVSWGHVPKIGSHSSLQWMPPYSACPARRSHLQRALSCPRIFFDARLGRGKTLSKHPTLLLKAVFHLC